MQAYKLYSNKYKMVPTKIDVRGCAIWNKGTFGARKIFEKSGNLTPCRIQKVKYIIDFLCLTLFHF